MNKLPCRRKSALLIRLRGRRDRRAPAQRALQQAGEVIASRHISEISQRQWGTEVVGCGEGEKGRELSDDSLRLRGQWRVQSWISSVSAKKTFTHVILPPLFCCWRSRCWLSSLDLITMRWTLFSVRCYLLSCFCRPSTWFSDPFLLQLFSGLPSLLLIFIDVL